MKNSNQILNERGNTLISVMISFGIMSIMSIAMMTMMDNQNKQLKYMEKRAEITNLKNTLVSVLQTPSICSYNLGTTSLATHTFPSNATDADNLKINLEEIKLSNNANAPVLVSHGSKLAPGLIVDKVELVNLVKPATGNQWTGEVQVSFLKEDGSPDMKPLNLGPQQFTVSDNNSSAASITGCLNASGGPGGASGVAQELPAGYQEVPVNMGEDEYGADVNDGSISQKKAGEVNANDTCDQRTGSVSSLIGGCTKMPYMRNELTSTSPYICGATEDKTCVDYYLVSSSGVCAYDDSGGHSTSNFTELHHRTVKCKAATTLVKVAP